VVSDSSVGLKGPAATSSGATMGLVSAPDNMGEEETAAANETSDSMRDLVFMLERFGESIPQPALRSYGGGKKRRGNQAGEKPDILTPPQNLTSCWTNLSHGSKSPPIPLYRRRIRRNTLDEP
jgi:hypothetical protein